MNLLKYILKDQKSPLEKRLSLVRKICKEIDQNTNNKLSIIGKYNYEPSQLQICEQSSRIKLNRFSSLTKSFYRSSSYSKALFIKRHILHYETWAKYNETYRNKNLFRYFIIDNRNRNFLDFQKYDLKTNSTEIAHFYQNLPRVRSLPQVN